MDVKYSTDTKVEDCFRVYKLQQAAFDKEINTAKAEAALAYELSAAKVSQKLKQEEKMGDVIERKKMVEIEEQEVQRKERDLVAAVKLPAEAEAFRVQTIGIVAFTIEHDKKLMHKRRCLYFLMTTFYFPKYENSGRKAIRNT